MTGAACETSASQCEGATCREEKDERTEFTCTTCLLSRYFIEIALPVFGHCLAGEWSIGDLLTMRDDGVAPTPRGESNDCCFTAAYQDLSLTHVSCTRQTLSSDSSSDLLPLLRAIDSFVVENRGIHRGKKSSFLGGMFLDQVRFRQYRRVLMNLFD